MTNRIMYDSVTAAKCPAGAPLYGAYIDGLYANYAEVHQRFPRARIVTITVLGGTAAAHVVDIETGDCTPVSGVAWAKRRVAAGHHPTLYMNASTWPAVKAEVHRQGLDGKVSYWVAHYDGHPVVPDGAVAKQFLGDYHGYDESVVLAHWPGVDPATSTYKTYGWARLLDKETFEHLAAREGITLSAVAALNPGVDIHHPYKYWGQWIKVRSHAVAKPQ